MEFSSRNTRSRQQTDGSCQPQTTQPLPFSTTRGDKLVSRIPLLVIGILAAFSISSSVFYTLRSPQLSDPVPLTEDWHHAARDQFNFRSTCEELARAVEEPFTQEYQPTNQAVDINGPQWAFYKWTGSNIALEDIEKLARSSPSFYLRFKILDKKLYFQKDVLDTALMYIQHRAKLLLSGIMMTLVWFDIPDVDFIVDLRDFPVEARVPAIVNCIKNKTGAPDEGFTVPFEEAIEKVFGPEQMSTMLACLKRRYPIENRTDSIVWRGTLRYVKNRFNPRKDLSFLVQRVKNMVDFGIVGYFLPENMNCAKWAYPSNFPGNQPCPEPVPGMIMEQFNQYSFVMDIDGRGWSGRLPFLMSSNTPIVKQVTQFVDYASVHLLNDHPVEFFKNDLSDFEDVVRESHHKRNISPIEYHEAMVRKMQNFSRTHYTHFGIARAMAYGLTVYANRTTWIPNSGGNFTRVPIDFFTITTLPKYFLDKLKLQFG